MNYDNALKLEENRLTALLPNYSGQHLLQLGGCNLLSLVKSPILHKTYISHLFPPNLLNYSCLQSTYTDLPFASDSINFVLLPHTLEFDKKNAKLILNEAWRILTPNGHLMLLGINPFSLWGLYRLFSFRSSSACDGYFYSIQTICQWIHYLGGQISHIESFLFRPPFTSNPGRWLFSKLLWLEKLSPWLFPYLGGIYLIIAQKQVKGLNKLGLIWQFPQILTDKTALAPNARGVHFV
ncbi:MAG: methyltransferase domain-containing protein [Rickettsiella sp.]|nr:methyltransferase domain-containing protein [Rickettsiella sp.]